MLSIDLKVVNAELKHKTDYLMYKRLAFDGLSEFVAFFIMVFLCQKSFMYKTHIIICMSLTSSQALLQSNLSIFIYYVIVTLKISY